MKTNLIEKGRLSESLERNESFWNNELEAGPLMWVTVPFAYAGESPPEPVNAEMMWTDVDY